MSAAPRSPAMRISSRSRLKTSSAFTRSAASSRSPDRRQDVVEVMGDPTGQHAKGPRASEPGIAAALRACVSDLVLEAASLTRQRLEGTRVVNRQADPRGERSSRSSSLPRECSLPSHSQSPPTRRPATCRSSRRAGAPVVLPERVTSSRLSASALRAQNTSPETLKCSSSSLVTAVASSSMLRCRAS